MPQPADAPTIYTVAQHAGVSVATVSRVLQGSTATSASARERVTRAVEELGYQPLRPRNRRPQTLGLVVPSLTGPESAALLLGMQAPDPAAGQARMLLACEGIGDATDVDEAVTRFAAQTDGLVICDATASDDVVAALAEQQPVVVLGRPAIRGCDVLDVDQQAPITELVAGLVALGRRRMVFVGDPAANRALAIRYAGFRAALAEQGLDEHAVPVAVAADASGADEALPRLLAARPGLDVAVCASDDLALRLMHVLVWRNVRVPDDLAITGWGDEPGASYVVPRLTTVSDPSRDLGRRAVDALRRRIADRGAPPIGYVSVPQVVWRESTGRP